MDNNISKELSSYVELPFKKPAQILVQGEIGGELAFRKALLEYVKKSLGKELQRHITYCSIKHNTLFIILDHPGALSLYRMREKELLENMRQWYKELKKSSPKAYWTKVKAYLKSDFKIFSQDITNKIEQNEEKAKGDFENQCKNEKLRAVFEEIRECVKYNKGKEIYEKEGLEMEVNVSIELD
ncbi:DciA family protein [Helicobacter sp. 13S00477-4]|uniref:DciA family protein n=1 Tax=Helicobacter sp. 13S00477-4 TaxID=1905759 RepID=UPI000BA6D959|nr:DciA family protein [Helicobacter sp. 13S00477-4]PAF51298.1 hypothetical protein BKH44_06225 [Helicobacter sp. 13S00477-4]